MTPKDITDAHLALQMFAGYIEEDTAIFAEFVNPERKPERGFLVDFLGSRIRTTSVWKEARTPRWLATLESLIACRLSCRSEEWIGLLTFVRNATDQYVAMELGAGFGPWTIAGGLGARSRGIKIIRSPAVEVTSPAFSTFAANTLPNGREPDRHTSIEATVRSQSRHRQWPVSEDPSRVCRMGMPPDPRQQRLRRRQFQKANQIESFRWLISYNGAVLGLVHIDVQRRWQVDHLPSRVAMSSPLGSAGSLSETFPEEQRAIF